jgi:hypothetical protein
LPIFLTSQTQYVSAHRIRQNRIYYCQYIVFIKNIFQFKIGALLVVICSKHPKRKEIKMKPYRSLTHCSRYLLILPILFTSATEAAVAVNKIPVAKAGSDQTVGLGAPVTLNGKQSTDKDGTIKAYHWRQTKGPKVILNNADTVSALFITPARTDNSKPLSMAFTLTVVDNKGAVARDSLNVYTVTGELNDTGISRCANQSINSLPCPVRGYLGLDAQSGRDVTRSNSFDGDHGFSFTKISSSGKALPERANDWDCVKDKVTGLTWEVKSDDGGLHDSRWTYSWYESDNTKNGGTVGVQNGGQCGLDAPKKPRTICDTAAYVKAINTAGLCSKKDWRLPTKEELHSIVHYFSGYLIDPSYFGYRDGGGMWSSSPYAGDSNAAWYVGFDYGYSYWTGKDYPAGIRLVRSGQ